MTDRNEYTPETLQKLRSLELETLRDFDWMCRDIGIDYFCWGKTALGAVLNAGFLPGDDRIRVGLLRGDYERFLEYVRKSYEEPYRFLNAENDPDYPLMTTRMCLRGTLCREKCFRDLSCDFGIFLEISCFDYVPDDDAARRKEERSVRKNAAKMIRCASGAPYPDGSGSGPSAVRQFGFRVRRGLYRLSGARPSRYYRRIRKTLKENGQKSRRAAWLCDPQAPASVIDVFDIFPTKRLRFENISIRCPSRVDRYLEQSFGDIRTVSPEQQRSGRAVYDLDFGDL